MAKIKGLWTLREGTCICPHKLFCCCLSLIQYNYSNIITIMCIYKLTSAGRYEYPCVVKSLPGSLLGIISTGRKSVSVKFATLVDGCMISLLYHILRVLSVIFFENKQ